MSGPNHHSFRTTEGIYASHHKKMSVILSDQLLIPLLVLRSAGICRILKMENS